MLDWLIAHSWIIPLAFTVLLTIAAAFLMPSIGDSGPDGAAEFSILMMLWIALNMAAWFLWGIGKIIF